MLASFQICVTNDDLHKDYFEQIGRRTSWVKHARTKVNRH